MKKITRVNLEKFLSQYKTEKKVLDIGCGDSLYKEMFPNRVSIDIDPKRKPDIVADVHSMPFKDEEFEVILCTEVLEHLINPQKAIDEMRRVLAPGGILILTTRFLFPIHDAPNDFFRFTKFGLEQLFSNWHIEKMQTEVGSLETMAVLLQRIIFQVKFRANKFIKFFLLLIIKFFIFLQKFIKIEYGDIKQEKICDNFMSSGYYMVCKK